MTRAAHNDDPASARRKLYWQCRRGMLELDTLLLNFFQHGYDALSPGEQQDFRALLACEDDVLYACLMGQGVPMDAAQAALIDKIRRLPLAAP